MKKKLTILNTVLAVAFLLAGGVYVVYRFAHFGRVVYTDNAQICREIIPINARISGYIRAIYYDDYSEVKKGDTLIIIDDTDIRLQVSQAEAQYHTACTAKQTTTAGQRTAQNNVSVSEAAIEEVRVSMNFAERDLERFKGLLQSGSCSQKDYDAAELQYKSLQAKYNSLTHSKTTTELVAAQQTEQISQAQASIDVAQANLDIARQNLHYTVITAPADGVVGKRDIQIGQLVQVGQTLLSLVHANEVWVIANYRETQLKHIQVGNEVEIKVDALPNTPINGRVERISAASGTAYTGSAQDNAMGNFVKVEQRVPVRICLQNNAPDILQKLQAGLNVECEIKY